MKIRNGYLKKAVTAAALSAAIAFGLLGSQITAFAATAATDSVMIRNDASTEAGLIGSLNEGDEVEILDVVQSGDGYLWYYIELDNGNTGYVRSDLINASDEELAAFNVKQEEEEPEEEPEAEAEPEQEEKGDQAKEDAAPGGQEISADQSTGVASEPAPEGYDASKDPNANFVVRYETDADGSGNWYVYNEDNGSRIRISDMQDQENASAASSSKGSGIWKILAIIFGILAAAFAAFSIFLIRSIRNSRPVRERRRVVEAAIEDEEDDESDEEEYYFEDDDSADDEDDDESDDEDEEAGDEEDEEAAVKDIAEPAADESVKTVDATITKQIAEENEIPQIPEEEIAAAIAADAAMTEEEEKSASETTEADAEFEEAPEEGSTAEPEETAEDVFEDEPEEGPAETTGNDGFAKADESEDYEEEDYEEEDYEEDGDDADEDFEEESDEESDEDYEEEDYEEEDFEDEDSYDDAEEDDEEEFGRGRSSRGSGRKKGGFLGFFKKVFGSDSDEDDDGDDFDDFDDEPVRRTFDEFKDYPEDIDLLPKEHLPEADFEEEEELFADDDSSYGERGRLTMQRVMKNVKYSDTDASFDEGGDVGDLSDSLFDDDDDMEYSFISSTRRK